MKFFRTRLLSFGLLCALLLAGCAQSQQNTDVVVARVDGREITRREFRIAYNLALPSSIASMIMQENPTEYLQNKVFNTLLTEALLTNKFEEYGITVSAEDEALIAQATELRFAEIMESSRSNAAKEGAADVDARAAELLLEEAKSMGFQSTEEYREYIAKQFRYNVREGMLLELLTKDITIPDSDLPALFERDVVTQKLDYTKDPSLYEAALQEYEAGTSTLPPLYTPHGLGYVKHILVADEALAQDIYNRLQQGENFDTLLEQYGTDPGMKEEPAKSRGYLFYYDAEFVEEFRQGVMTLEKEGAYTAPVQSELGYHIIKLVQILDEKPTPWEEVAEIYPAAKLEEVKIQAFTDQVNEWFDEVQMDSYISRIRDIS